jgi:hypothetical protein
MILLFGGVTRIERVVVWGRVHLGLGCLALVSPADDAEDHESGNDDNSQERDVRRWSGIRSNTRG